MNGRTTPHPDQLADFCRRNQIRRLSLFGSVLHGAAGPESDVDLLVEFQAGAHVGYLDMARMEGELSDLFGGQRVDLRTAAELSRYFRDELVREAGELFAEA